MTRSRTSSSASSAYPSLFRRIRDALRRRPNASTGSEPEPTDHVVDVLSDVDDDHPDLGDVQLEPARDSPAATLNFDTMRDHSPTRPSRSQYLRESYNHDQPALCMAFYPTRSLTPRPPCAPAAASPVVFLLPRLTAAGPTTPTSIIERERYLQPADRRNLDLTPNYNPLSLLPPLNGASRSRGPRHSPTSDAAWFDALTSDQQHVPDPPRYGDRRQSRRIRPDEVRLLEEQLEQVLAEDQLGRPPAYQRRTVYV